MRHRLGEHPGLQRGDLTGPNPVDRGKKGSKIHLITDRTGLPLSIAIWGPTPTMARPCNLWYEGLHRSAPGVGPAGAHRASYTATRAATTPTCAAGSVSAGSCTAWLARVWSPRNG